MIGETVRGIADTPASCEQPRLGTPVFVILAILLSALTAATVAAPRYLPTNDGPEHVFASHAAQRLDDASLGYGRHLELGTTLSQVGFDRLLAFCELFLPWRSALRVCLTFMVLLWAWGVVALAAAVGGRKRIWLGLFGFAAAVQWALYMGFFPFYLSSAFGLYVLALSFMRTEWSTRWRLLLSAALTIQAFLHPMPTLCSMMVLAIMSLLRGWSRGLAREALALALMVAPAVAVVLANVGPWHGSASGWWIMPAPDRALLAMRAFVSGPFWRWLGLPLAALGGAGLCIAHRQWRNDRRLGALLLAGLAFALLATQAPYHIPGWNFFHMRFSPYATILLALLLPIERWSRAFRLVGLFLLVSYATASNVWALGYNLNLYRASSDLLSGLDVPLHRSGVRLPLILEGLAGQPRPFLERAVPGCLPNWNTGALYAVEQGGVPAFGFAESETIHHLVWRWPVGKGLRPPRPTRGFEHSASAPAILSQPGGRKAVVTHLLSYTPFYEDVIFYGRPEEVSWLRDRRFDIDYAKGGLAIARFHACPLVLELTPGPSGQPATWIDFGWTPASQTVQHLELPGAPDATTAREIDIQSPCGEVWFRIVFDSNPDGQLGSGDTGCLESGQDAAFGVRVQPSGSRVVCRPGRMLELAASPVNPRESGR